MKGAKLPPTSETETRSPRLPDGTRWSCAINTFVLGPTQPMNLSSRFIQYIVSACWIIQWMNHGDVSWCFYQHHTPGGADSAYPTPDPSPPCRTVSSWLGRPGPGAHSSRRWRWSRSPATRHLAHLDISGHVSKISKIYQNDLWISVDICGYLCYVFFVDFNPLLYPFWRHAQISQKICNLEAELPNSSTLVFILEGKLRHYPQLWKSSPIWSRSCALNLRHPPAQARPAAAVVSCPWSCQDDTPGTAACRRDSLHPAGHTPRCLRPERSGNDPCILYPSIPESQLVTKNWWILKGATVISVIIYNSSKLAKTC